jgi:hypothetical protein
LDAITLGYASAVQECWQARLNLHDDDAADKLQAVMIMVARHSNQPTCCLLENLSTCIIVIAQGETKI